MTLRIVALLLALATAAQAQTRRFAVVVGNNAGNGALPPLHYAEADAAKLAAALVEVGGFDEPDLLILQGRDLAAVRAALEQTRAAIDAWRGRPDGRVLLVFYFSGHSDGGALEVGRDSLPFAELRRWLEETKAETRLVIVDSCKSGALLRRKGGRPGPPFDVRLVDDLASRGEVLLASAAADESALESSEIRGSFFTHHLVSGLRGAADLSGDGQVTLAEAYAYAYRHTVSATAETIEGPQHPGFDYRFSGQGELVLSLLSRVPCELALPTGFDRILVIQLRQDRVLAELRASAARKIALAPGEYTVRGMRAGRWYAKRLTVGGIGRAVDAEELLAAPVTPATSKGVPPVVKRRARLALSVGAGVRGSVASNLPARAATTIALGSATPSGWLLMVDGSTARGSGFLETTALVFAGARLGSELGPLRLVAGLVVGGGVVLQSLDWRGLLASGALGGAIIAGISLRLGGRWRLSLDGQVPLLWLRRDGTDAAVVLPAGWVSVGFEL